MSAKGHVRVFVIATLAWAGFWVLGLPSYYHQYSRATMIALSLALLPPIVAVSYALLKPLPPSRRLRRAAWFAFYFSVPLAAYDWLYCGVYLDYGVRFLLVFWYLTLFYFIPWVVLPATAIVLNGSDKAAPRVTAA